MQERATVFCEAPPFFPSDPPGENQPTDHARKRAGCLLVARPFRERRRHQPPQPIQTRADALAERPLYAARPALGLGTGARDHEPALGMREVRRIQVAVDHRLQRPIAGRRRGGIERPRRLSARVAERLRDELLFRLEVRVKPTVRQPGAAHDVTDPDRADALSAKCRRRGLQHPPTRFRFLSARPWHNNILYIIFSIMPPRRSLVPAAALALLASAAPARAQLPVSSRDAAGHITIRATRITTPIKVDGKLDEEAYRETEALTDFIQSEPQQGAPASERTEAWVLFDDDNLYLACRCWDR